MFKAAFNMARFSAIPCSGDGKEPTPVPVIGWLMHGNDDTELYKQFTENDSFRRWMTDTVFKLTYQPTGLEP